MCKGRREPLIWCCWRRLGARIGREIPCSRMSKSGMCVPRSIAVVSRRCLNEQRLPVQSRERKRRRELMRYVLAGLSIASTAEAVETHDQLGGSGCVRNKALAIPGHLNGQEGGPWASVEYVSIDPIREGEISSVGQHTQTTDEIYC